jgi:hypothetical protein
MPPSASQVSTPPLKPCPSCGKKEGELVDRRPAKFPYGVICGACGFSTDFVKFEALAVKLWNEAKRRG